MVLNRSVWCRQNEVEGHYINTSTGKEEGSFTLPYRAFALANPADRQVHVWFHGDDYHTSDSFSGWSTLGLKVECVRLADVGCTANQGYVTQDIGDWDDGDWYRWDLKSDENVATQMPEKVLRNLFSFSGYAIDDFDHEIELSSETRPGIRCDSAAYFVTRRACVFTDVTPHLIYRYNQGYNEVLDHIRQVQDFPDTTHPPKVGPKVIPGKFSLTLPSGLLSRMATVTEVTGGAAGSLK
ncbi:hypothetical protein [Actinokineospora enzanensis]|uniref:hypothetical protein n=1 Tax=Actinokineospora enzanensis TaxID=155975 RepID=UPI0012EC0A34|nr:hypothetical protein [Actinokineospora enzanensis]